MDIYAEITNRIISEMETGIIPWQKPFLKGFREYITLIICENPLGNGSYNAKRQTENNNSVCLCSQYFQCQVVYIIQFFQLETIELYLLTVII